MKTILATTMALAFIMTFATQSADAYWSGYGHRGWTGYSYWGYPGSWGYSGCNGSTGCGYSTCNTCGY